MEEDYLTKHFAPLVKKGRQIVVAVPGLKKEFTAGVPAELLPYWGDNMNFHSCDWWYNLWQRFELVNIAEYTELNCYKKAWEDWLACDNEYARQDINMMEAEGGKYFNLVAILATRV